MRIIHSLIFFVCISLLPAFCFSQNWQTYPYSPAGSVLTFPNDEGNHAGVPSTKTEWWYINLHLFGSAPQYKDYDVMLCYFSTGNMRIFNISSGGTFKSNVLQAYPTFISQPNKWDFTYSVPAQISDNSQWTFPTDNKTFKYVFNAQDPTNNDLLNVTVTSNRPPLVVGKNGFIALGNKGDSSFYYSLTNMNVHGTIKYNGVSDSITSGIGWIDRQWGPFTVGINANNKYEWFSMQADKPNTVLGQPQTPSEYNIWQIYSDSSSVPYQPEWRMVSTIFPDDSQDTSSSYFYERTGYWHDVTNKQYYSSHWRLIDPKHGVNIDMTPKIANQIINVTLFKFWEGTTTLKGTVNNLPITGVGFAELVAAHNSNIVLPSVPSGLSVTPNSDHFSLTWSASNAGTYPVGGYRIFRSRDNSGYWQYLATTHNLTYDDYSVTTDSTYYYTVTSFDNQTATSASDYANPISALLMGINSPANTIAGLAIYPNPSTGIFNVQMNKLENVQLSIYDVIGKCIYQHNATGANLHIDLSKAPNGVYFLQLKTSEGLATKKLVISK